MQGISRQTLILFWFFVLILAGIQFRAGASILPSCLLAITLLAGAIDIPITRKRMRKPNYSMDVVHLLEEVHSVALEQDFSGNKRFFDTVIAVNLGGFVIPFLAACCLGVIFPNLASIEIGAIMIAATYSTAVFREGFGITLPGYLGVLPILLATLLVPGDAAVVAFVAGVLGILIGECAVLSAIDPERQGCARIVIGGAGSFQAVYITMLLAILTLL
ncbi:MAG: DUF1614 domain-containing protein [Candidatus Methanogasteraceae archaeon]